LKRTRRAVLRAERFLGQWLGLGPAILDAKAVAEASVGEGKVVLLGPE